MLQGLIIGEREKHSRCLLGSLSVLFVLILDVNSLRAYFLVEETLERSVHFKLYNDAQYQTQTVALLFLGLL